MKPVPPDRVVNESRFRIGKIDYHVVVTEGWRPTDAGLVVKCGKDQVIQCASKLGVSESQSSSFKASLGSTLGVKDVASIQSTIESSVTHQVNWSEEKSVTVPVELIAPTCGAQLYYVFALVRTYEISASRERWLRAPLRIDLPRLHEWTAIYRAHVIEDEHDEKCPCTPEEVEEGTPVTIGFQVGNLQLFVEGMRQWGRTKARLLGRVIEIEDFHLGHDVKVQWPDASAFLSYFSGLQAGEILLDLKVFEEEAVDEPVEAAVGLEMLPDEGLLIRTSTDEQRYIEV